MHCMDFFLDSSINISLMHCGDRQFSRLQVDRIGRVPAMTDMW